jgi:2-octaprenyl-6-methoxyphenol hydroxylase
MMSRDQNSYDVILAGGGIVGTALALALRKSLHGALRVAVIDPRRVAKDDERAFALSRGSCRMLEMLGVWHEIARDAQAINEMIITDSRVSDPVRPVFLTFEKPAMADEPFAYMIPEQVILNALLPAAEKAGVEFLDHRVTRVIDQPDFIEARCDDGVTRRASLLVACDGAKSPIREEAGISWITWAYRQSGIVATIGHDEPHHGRAEEHFLPSGPFAILPLKGNRASIVWTEETDRANALVARSEFEIHDEIERRFGLHLGQIKLLSKPRAYPLGFGIAREFGKGRLALAGDAAHIIHPIAGQGLNMGLRDAAALAEAIVESVSLGLEAGSPGVIESYDHARRADTVAMGAVTDVLNRLFANDVMPIRLLRDFGLGLVNRMPRLKDRLIENAAANRPNLPRLIRGEPLNGMAA